MADQSPHVDEAGRLQALRRYQILDTPPDDAFDRITRLVAKLLKCPIALVSLVDADRLWFKSRHGLDVPELPRAGSFCDEAIQCNDTMVVPDTLLDRRFKGNALVVGGPKIRFYAGTPLSVAGGVKIGTLCAIHTQPRELSDAELQALRDLAAVVVDALELRRSAAIERQLMEGKFDALFEYSPDANILVNEQGAITRANNQAELLFGYSRSELKGLPVEELLPESAGGAHRGLREKFSAGAQPRVMGASRAPLQARTKSGAAVPVEISLSRLQFDDGTQVLAAVRDITARVQAEQDRQALEHQLRQSQKMEAIGRLAGGVAHDFNNMLQIIEGYTHLARSEPDNCELVAMCLDQVTQAAVRASDLTRRLLAFGRQQVLHRSPFPVGRLVQNLVKMVSRLIGERIELTVRVPEDDPVVDGDAGLLEQVLINVCVNARDAMPQGGRLSIDVSRLPADVDFCARYAWAKPGPYVLIELRDSGIGMTPEVQQRIFEPFFTTKEVGQGTGLGLPMAYGIVQQHEGGIEIESAPGRGTACRIYLPIGQALTATEPARAETGASGGQELLLIAEDEAAVRNFFCAVLRKNGYRVLAAQDGEEALALHRENSGAIDLAILDMVMPRRDGRSTYELLRQSDPHLRVLFTTGYAGDLANEDFALRQGITVLRKPYAPEALLNAVRAVLD